MTRIPLTRPTLILAATGLMFLLGGCGMKGPLKAPAPPPADATLTAPPTVAPVATPAAHP
ncbi:MAG: hypothetical protein KUL86_14345 [Castellaniella sp.]|nr:hypothetical protein [Castellaniella sp.]